MAPERRVDEYEDLKVHAKRYTYRTISMPYTILQLLKRTNVLFVFGLTSLLNILGHIATVLACSSCTLTNVLPHRNAMLRTQDMTPHPVTVYRHRANLSRCYPLVWNVTLECTATQLNREVKISLRQRQRERHVCVLTSSFLVFFLRSYSL